MRRTVIASFVIGVLSSAAAAQAADAVTGGFVAGLNFANVSVDTGTSISVSPSTKAGLLLGGFVMIPLTKPFSLQPEFLFVQRSFDLQTGTSASGLYQERWSAVEIPILARYDLALSGGRGFYVVLGPAFSFLGSATETRGSSSIGTDVKNDLAGADVSVVLGAGVTFGKIGVEARFDAGLKEVSSPAPTTGSEKNRAFALLFRYKIN